MNKSELILERRHARFMMRFYRLHRLGSYKASATYQYWLKQYNDIKEQLSKPKLKPVR